MLVAIAVPSPYFTYTAKKPNRIRAVRIPLSPPLSTPLHFQALTLSLAGASGRRSPTSCADSSPLATGVGRAFRGGPDCVLASFFREVCGLELPVSSSRWRPKLTRHCNQGSCVILDRSQE